MKVSDAKSLVGNCIPFSPLLGKLFGMCGALMLQQVHYWCLKNGHLREGQYWTYQTAKDWVQQLMVFEERSVRAKVKELREAGVLVIGNFNKKAYDQTLWYRLDYDKLHSEMVKAYPHLQILQVHCGKFCRLIPAELAVPIPKTTAETTTETSLATAAPSLTETDQELIDIPEVEPMAKGPSMAAELLAHMKNHGQPVAKPNSAHSLELTFKTVAPKYNEMTCIPSFTMKDKGQLGRLAKSWGNKADEVMHTVCSDWIAFAKDVAKELGFSKYPLVPHLPFIVKYAGHALAYHKAASPVQPIAQNEQWVAKAGIPVVEENQVVTPPKKKLVIIKKAKQSEPQELVSEKPVQVAEQSVTEEDAPLTLADLLSYKKG